MDFQTPIDVRQYMVSMVKGSEKVVLEPAPGEGYLAKDLTDAGHIVLTPKGNYWDMDHGVILKYDYVVMNPPFTPMVTGYRFLYDAMERADNVIALLPWLAIINSEKRIADIMGFGLVSITALPRKVFKGSRVQCCVLNMKKGYQGTTEFIKYQP